MFVGCSALTWSTEYFPIVVADPCVITQVETELAEVAGVWRHVSEPALSGFVTLTLSPEFSPIVAADPCAVTQVEPELAAASAPPPVSTESKRGGESAGAASWERDSTIVGGNENGNIGVGASRRARQVLGETRDTITASHPFRSSHSMLDKTTMVPMRGVLPTVGGGVGLRLRSLCMGDTVGAGPARIDG